jgi:dihydrofolate reductase
MGASIVQQCLTAALLDELTIELVPVVLTRGVRLLDGLEPGSVSWNWPGSSTLPASRT